MWGFLIGIGEFIAGLFQTSIDAIVASLVWAVGALQATTIALWNGVKGAFELARVGFGKVWDFFKPVYLDVLKPAWLKFWKWFDTARAWLDKTFGPVLRWLIKLRQQLLDFWKTYVRPWLDLIDVTRKLLRTLAALGLDWAKALDRELGALEEKITAPFLFLLGKLNDIINVVNTVVTADGLFQRVALIRSLARDYQYAWNALTLPYLHNQEPPKDSDTSALDNPKSITTVAADVRSYLVDEGGELAPAVNEAAAQFAIYLRS